MTDFSAIPSGDVDPDSPLTTGLVIKLRDNHLAQAEGASGAPKILEAAMNAKSINRDAAVDAATGSQLVITRSAGNELTTNTLSTSYIKMSEFYFPYGGVFKMKFDLRNPTGSFTAYAQIWIDGVAEGIGQATSNPGFQTRTEDITVPAGGALVQLYQRQDNSSHQSEVQRFRAFELEARQFVLDNLIPGQ